MHRIRIILVVLLLSALVNTKATGQQKQADEPSSKSNCLTVAVDTPPDTLIQACTPLKFIAQVLDTARYQQLNFKWSVSAGAITNGQGTSAITVDTTSLMGQIITATVEVDGLLPGCAKTASASMTMQFICGLHFDLFGVISLEDEQARLDNFANELQVDPSGQAYIIGYGGRHAHAREAQTRADRAKKYLVNYQHTNVERIVTVDRGYRAKGTT